MSRVIINSDMSTYKKVYSAMNEDKCYFAAKYKDDKRLLIELTKNGMSLVEARQLAYAKQYAYAKSDIGKEKKRLAYQKKKQSETAEARESRLLKERTKRSIKKLEKTNISKALSELSNEEKQQWQDNHPELSYLFEGDNPKNFEVFETDI